jgi:hydroxymethylglutaryl-CoA lyase
MTLYPPRVRIVEVGPRDGLQNEKNPVSVATKVAFIDMLSDSGLMVIESGSFVSPKWVPQMADSDKVMAQIKRKDGVSYPVLVPNDKGMDAAIAAGATEIAVFAAASESFSQKNINCTIDESLARFKPVIEKAQAHNIKVRGYVSCVLGCPFEGDIAPEAAARVARALYDMGCYEISLGDTIGTGTPDKTSAMLMAVKKEIPVTALAVHFHDTYHRALDNIRAALAEGVSVIDSATGGLGGCPYAPGASGNVSTEAVLGLMQQLGIKTGVDPAKIAVAAQFIRSQVVD